MCALRGDDIGMVFQEPMTALNPVKTIGEQVAEGIRWHTRATPRRRRGARAKNARPRRPARGEIPAVALPARTLRRPAPARRHRHRLRAEAEAADRRRADDGARRGAAGADPRPAARSRRGKPHGAAADLARPRRGDRDGRPHHHPAPRRGDGGRRHGAHAVANSSIPTRASWRRPRCMCRRAPEPRSAGSSQASAPGRRRDARLSRAGAPRCSGARRADPRRRRCLAVDGAGPVGGAGRPLRLRQVDARPHDPGAGPADVRARSAFAARPSPARAKPS